MQMKTCSTVVPLVVGLACALPHGDARANLITAYFKANAADACQLSVPTIDTGLLPVSQTPSLGVMMKPEVANGKEDVYSRVQA